MTSSRRSTRPCEPRVLTFLDRHRLPAAACGIVRDGALAWSFGAGYTDRETSAGPRSGHALPGRIDHQDVRRDRHPPAPRRRPPAARRPAGPARPGVRGRVEPVRPDRGGDACVGSCTHTLRAPGRGPVPGSAPRADVPTRGAARASWPRSASSSRPTRRSKYSNLGFELLGEVVRRVEQPIPARLPRDGAHRPTRDDGDGLRPCGRPGPGPADGRRPRGPAPRRRARAARPRTSPSYYEADGGLWSTVEDLATVARRSVLDGRHGPSGRRRADPGWSEPTRRPTGPGS